MKIKLLLNEIKKTCSIYSIWAIFLLFLFITILMINYLIINNPITNESSINNFYITSYIFLHMTLNITLILCGFAFMYSSIKERVTLIYSRIYPINLNILLISRFLILYFFYIISIFIIWIFTFIITKYSLSNFHIILNYNQSMSFLTSFWMMIIHFLIMPLPFLLISFALPLINKINAINILLIIICHMLSYYPTFAYNPFRLTFSTFSIHHVILTGNSLFNSSDILKNYFISLTYIMLIYQTIIYHLKKLPYK